MQKLFHKRARTFGVLGLLFSSIILGVSLSSMWLLNDTGIIFTLAIATVSLQLILNDLFWRTQRRTVERGQVLLHCQLNSRALHVLRRPLLTVQALISSGMLLLIWSTLFSGAIWLAMRHRAYQGYLTIVWFCGCVLSLSWFAWVFAGRRALNDDEIIISEYACLASGRLDRWDLPGWRLVDAEFRDNPAATGGTLLLRILHSGPHRQQLIERYLPFPVEYMAEAQNACRHLKEQIANLSKAHKMIDSGSSQKAKATAKKQQLVEPVTNPVRASQLGNVLLLLFAAILAWIDPYLSRRVDDDSLVRWSVPLVALAFGACALANILLNWRRNASFKANLEGETLLLYRMPSLWLECHQPEALNAARRELFNDGLLMIIGTFFTGLAFAIRLPHLFEFFWRHEIALMLVAELIPFLGFVVYRDWALRRRLGLVRLTRDGVWLYDRQHRWDNKLGRLHSATLSAPPPKSLEAARLVLHYEYLGNTEEVDDDQFLQLQLPLDAPAAKRVEQLLPALGAPTEHFRPN